MFLDKIFNHFQHVCVRHVSHFEKVGVCGFPLARPLTLWSSIEAFSTCSVDLLWDLVFSGVEARKAGVIEGFVDTLDSSDVCGPKVTTRFFTVLAEFVGASIDNILHHLCVVNPDEIDQIIFPSELYILELSKVCYIESCVPMYPDLRFSITGLKVYAILVKGLLGSKLLHFDEVTLRQFTFKWPNVELDIVILLIVLFHWKVRLN